jgi:uncharacterized protein YdhG (YjbR/CyaY superfamily)
MVRGDKTMPASMPETTRAFLAALPDDQRQALEHLRRVIIAAAPEAEEYVGYGIPAFRQDGALVSFGAAKNHCALYVQSPAVMAAMAADLKGLDTSKGTVRFPADNPLPDALVTRLVKARIAENTARKQKGRKPASANQ